MSKYRLFWLDVIHNGFRKCHIQFSVFSFKKKECWIPYRQYVLFWCHHALKVALLFSKEHYLIWQFCVMFFKCGLLWIYVTTFPIWKKGLLCKVFQFHNKKSTQKKLKRSSDYVFYVTGVKIAISNGLVFFYLWQIPSIPNTLPKLMPLL